MCSCQRYIAYCLSIYLNGKVRAFWLKMDLIWTWPPIDLRPLMTRFTPIFFYHVDSYLESRPHQSLSGLKLGLNRSGLNIALWLPQLQLTIRARLCKESIVCYIDFHLRIGEEFHFPTSSVGNQNPLSYEKLVIYLFIFCLHGKVLH